MKKAALLSLTISLVFGLAGTALACHFTGLTPTVNCDGWSVTGTIYFAGASQANLTYTVTLSDADGTVVQFTGAETIYDSAPTFTFGAPWGVELCGDYTATGTFSFTSTSDWDSESFSTTFTCTCDEPNGCTGTPGYWKNHPDAWPVESLTIGGLVYPKAQVMEIFDMNSGGGDATIKLFHHLAAAKLNVLHGADGSGIMTAIANGDAFLATYGFLCKPKGALKTECNAIKDALVAFNESLPCGDVMIVPTAALMTTDGEREVETTWGAFKTLYQ